MLFDGSGRTCGDAGTAALAEYLMNAGSLCVGVKVNSAVGIRRSLAARTLVFDYVSRVRFPRRILCRSAPAPAAAAPACATVSGMSGPGNGGAMPSVNVLTGTGSGAMRKIPDRIRGEQGEHPASSWVDPHRNTTMSTESGRAPSRYPRHGEPACLLGRVERPVGDSATRPRMKCTPRSTAMQNSSSPCRAS
jgi:hypothetical protein